MGVSARELPAEERAGRAQARTTRIPVLLEAFDRAWAGAASGRDRSAVLAGSLPGTETAARELLSRASAPYDDFVHADPMQAARAGERLLADRAGEGAPPHLRLLLEGDRPIACIAALSWKDLGGARLRAARALGRAGLLADPEVRTRVRLAADTLAEPQEGDAYLARIAVSPGARRRGIARALLEALEQGARRAGFRRIVLEASAASPQALRLYRGRGYEELTRRRAESRCGARLEYVHMARRLQPWPPSDSSSGSGSGTRP